MNVKREIEQFNASKNNNLNEIYACTGNRAYIVGGQDGSFPDMGHHVVDEMGGVWIHPIKLMDGFWLKISN